MPSGFDFDAFTTDALLTQMTVNNGHIVTTGGMSYQMMILPENGELTLNALRKIASLVYEGANVYGIFPTGSQSLCDLNHQSEYNKLARAVWGEDNSLQCHRYGKGCVYWGMSVSEAATKAGITPDITLPEDRKVYYAHRTTNEGDIYFLNNREDTPLIHNFIFRAPGKTAELWHPVTGKRYALQSTSMPDGSLSIPLIMAPRESYFIIIRHYGNKATEFMEWNQQEQETPIEGSWEVYFNPDLGGPGKVTFPRLNDWTLNRDKRIRYYSGTAVYRNVCTIDSIQRQTRYLLRFTKLASVAEVEINQKHIGLVWCSPWEIDITDAVKPGINELTIRITNSLMNRLIGDSMLPLSERITYSATPIARPDDKLTPSGIIGNVSIVRIISDR